MSTSESKNLSKSESKDRLSGFTVFSYAMSYGSGYQIMGSLVGSYLMVFLTDTFGVPAGAVGVIMVLASIWDAVNDPMMGVLADKTHTRFGRYRPYFLFIPALLTVDVVLLFASPNISVHGKIAWTAVFYVLYGMLRTAIEIPCNALINAITNNEKDRNRLITSNSFTMGVFTTLTTSFALAAVSVLGQGNTAKGYMMVVGFAGVLMTISCWMCFAATKEKYVSSASESHLLAQIKKVFAIKGVLPAVIIWTAGYLGYNIMMGCSVYYIEYCLCRPDLITAYMMTISVPGLIAILFLVPILLRTIKSMKKAFAFSQIAVLICNVICWLFHDNLVVIFISSAVAAMFATVFMVFGSMLMTEIQDLVYYKSGSIMNGVIAALKGFSNKCGIALSNGIVSGVLAVTGYVANAIGEEPEATVNGIVGVRFLVPAATAVIIVIALSFYPVTEEMKVKFRSIYKEAGTDDKAD